MLTLALVLIGLWCLVRLVSWLVQARLADQERELRTGDSPVARAWRRGRRENRMLREFHEHGLTLEVQALVNALDEDAPLPLPPRELTLLAALVAWIRRLGKKLAARWRRR